MLSAPCWLHQTVSKARAETTCLEAEARILSVSVPEHSTYTRVQQGKT